MLLSAHQKQELLVKILQNLQLPHTSQANTLNGKPLAKIKEITEPVTVLMYGHYDEKIPLHLIATPQIPIILGYHWLVKHNPHIGWVSRTILGWSTYNLSQCLSSAFSLTMCTWMIF